MPSASQAVNKLRWPASGASAARPGAGQFGALLQQQTAGPGAGAGAADPEPLEVENGLHWVLDVAFRKDGNRTRRGNAGANLGMLRRVAASLLKQVGQRGSIKAKRLSAALDDAWRLHVLQRFKRINAVCRRS